MEIGLRKPEFRQDEDFMETLWGRNGVTTGSDKHNDSLKDRVNSTCQAIKANPGIQRKRISELIGKSIPTIDRQANKRLKRKNSKRRK